MLYEQLDIYLDSEDALKSMVYEAHDPFDSMDQFVPPASLASGHLKQEVQGRSPSVNNNASKNSNNVSSNVCDNAALKKKKNRRRGRKNKVNNKSDGQQGDVRPTSDDDEVERPAIELVNEVLENPPNENVKRDEVILLSSNISKENIAKCSHKPSPKSNKKAIVVPPDMLSSCSDITDDESACSDEVDLESIQEDCNFIRAQRTADRRAKKSAAKVTQAIVKLVATGEEVVVDNTAIVKEKASLGSAFSMESQESCASGAADGKSRGGRRKETVLERLKKEKSKSASKIEEMVENMSLKNEEAVDKKRGDISSPDKHPTPKPVPTNTPGQLGSLSQMRAHNNMMNHPLLQNTTNSPGFFQNRIPEMKPKQSSRTVPSVAQVMRLCNWPKFVQKVGYVVHILEARNTRLAAGTLKPFADMNRNFALFSPNDNRIPRMKVPMGQCPPDFFARKAEYAKKIYLAKIAKWNEPKFALG